MRAAAGGFGDIDGCSSDHEFILIHINFQLLIINVHIHLHIHVHGCPGVR
jgi:hypothetical protein